MSIIASLRGPLRAVSVLATALAFVVAVPHGAYAAPGDLDTTFGTGGKVSITTPSFADGQDVAVQADGKIVSVGFEQDPVNLDAEFAVLRHNPDGSVDTSFGGTGGGGDGEVLTDFEGGDDVAQGVAVQPDGKIVVVGRHQETDDEFAGCCWFTVARYNTDGSVDTSFGGGDGWVSPGLAGGAEDAAGVAVRPDGRIVAGARAGGLFGLVRYLPDGSPDPAFGGGDGVVTTSLSDTPGVGATARDLALQPDGKVVVIGDVGQTSFDFALARYNPDGSLDTTFGGDGKVTTDLGGYNWGEAVVVQSSGKIVASGWSGGRFTLVRYNLDGSLDSGFGTGGVATTDFGTGSAVNDLVVQPDDRIVAGGTAGGDFALARFHANGTLDTGFGTNGRTTTDFGAGDSAYGLALQPDGKTVAFGSNGDGLRGLARYLGGEGAPQPTGVDLAVTKSGTATVSIGDRATYTVTVTNTTATTSATGVGLTDTVTGPAATVVSATPGQGTCTISATGATCALGALAGGASTTVTVVVEPRATGTLTDRATVSATQPDPDPADNTATATTAVANSRGCTRIGTSGDDTMTGTSGNDVICGLGGADTINAGLGTDTAYGNFGNDRVDGAGGNDTLNGGPGNDNLIGNAGNDRLDTVDNIPANDTANGGLGTDTCTTDPGDTRISCP
ncbi:calcium-binding protein [Streptomyces europaeiscabiei]|uniref:calcium-binding protein n=1 Tax=Streptomyces europaeiscabiei TaxID=146819 RepID=UPI002E2AB9EB|nr:calcium-binding protein [Streptomyces europaeiscabiei]